jgi:hypothetical protein
MMMSFFPLKRTDVEPENDTKAEITEEETDKKKKTKKKPDKNPQDEASPENGSAKARKSEVEEEDVEPENDTKAERTEEDTDKKKKKKKKQDKNPQDEASLENDSAKARKSGSTLSTTSAESTESAPYSPKRSKKKKSSKANVSDELKASQPEEETKKSKKKKSNKATSDETGEDSPKKKKKKKKAEEKASASTTAGESADSVAKSKKKKKKKGKKTSKEASSENEDDPEPVKEDEEEKPASNKSIESDLKPIANEGQPEPEVPPASFTLEEETPTSQADLFGKDDTRDNLSITPGQHSDSMRKTSSKKPERRRSQSHDQPTTRRSSKKHSSVKSEEGKEGSKKRSSSLGKYAKGSKKRSSSLGKYAKRTSATTQTRDTDVGALKEAFASEDGEKASSPNAVKAREQLRSLSADPGEVRQGYMSQVSGGDNDDELKTRTGEDKRPSITIQGEVGLDSGGRVGNAHLSQVSGGDDDDELKTRTGEGKRPSITMQGEVGLDSGGRVGNAYLSQVSGGDDDEVLKTPPSEDMVRMKRRRGSAPGGSVQNAYLNHVSGGNKAEDKVDVPPKKGEERGRPLRLTKPQRRASSTGKIKSNAALQYPVSGGDGHDVLGSTSSGSVHNAYLNHVSGGDKTEDKVDIPPETGEGRGGPLRLTKPQRRSSSAGKIKNNAASQHPVSGGNDDDVLKTPPREDKATMKAIGGRVRKAYLNHVSGGKKAEDKLDVPPKKGEGRGRSLRLTKPQRRASSTGDSNAALQYLGIGLMGKNKSRISEPVSPSTPLPSKPDAFATPFTSYKQSLFDDKNAVSPVRRMMNLTALNLATPVRPSKALAPRPKDLKKLLSQDADASFADSVVLLLKDETKKSQVTELCDRIQKADGLPKTRRLSMRDNDLTVDIIKAIQNDPDVTEIVVDGDVAFNTISTALLFQFVEALSMNLHLKRLTFKAVQLGNDILYALATSLETNFVLEELDLSQNLFTSEGLAEFCQALANSNKACKTVNLENQTTPISIASEVDVLEAFSENKRLTKAKVDFNSKDGQEKLTKILKRNEKQPPKKIDFDKTLIELLMYEAERAEALMEQRKAENKPLEVPEDDWDYLYELAVLFDKYKLKEIVESENDDSKKKSKPKNADSLSKTEKSNFLFGLFKDILDDSIGCFNSDGSFLTPEFISKHLKKTQDTDELVFDFHGQWKLFKRFPVTDPNRELIVTKFVDAIVTHPEMKVFMGINMANTGCGDDFLEKLAERCLADPKLLPNLHMINFETNFINERGCVALSKLISSPTSLRYLQVVRMENQKGLLTSKAEFSLLRAMFVNRSVVVVSLRFRGLLERQQIPSYVCRNVDFLRQARQRHYKKTGTGRKRNETEVYFDKIAANDKSITEVNLPANRKIHSLSLEETIKAAQAFAKNTHVKSINLNGCKLGNEFAEAMGKSLATNNTIEKLLLENNSISGTGIRYLFEGVAQNSCLLEFRLHKQSKMIVAADEDSLADILDPNQMLTKLGIDFRSQNAQVKIERNMKRNDRLKRSGDSTDNLKYLF